MLEGSNGGEAWELIDSRDGEAFSHRYATQFYMTEADAAYDTFRLTVNATGGANQLQIGELQLLSLKAGDPTSMNEELRMRNEELSDDIIFNLSGQRLKEPQKGINIIGGKKIIVK